MKTKQAVVVGAGFGGLTLSALLARQGMRVRVLEKNGEAGGRARVWSRDGFTFDMGPTWYLMPEVFETFFSGFGLRREAFYGLATLDPSYRVFFGSGEVVDVVRDLSANLSTVEGMEAGAAARLRGYLADSRHKYEVALSDFLYREYTSPFQFLNRRMMTEGLKLNVFQGLDRYTSRFFKDPRVRQLLEYHMVFLGNRPSSAPALYSLMSHADLNLGVFYPTARPGSGGKGGMGAVVQALLELNASLGVEILTRHEVEHIEVRDGAARSVRVKGKGEVPADLVAVNADYPHAEMSLLDPAHAGYPARYWERKVIAPSMFLMYLGLTRRPARLAHHTLHFASDWDPHFDAITRRPAWPQKPCFYLCAPSRTDPAAAPPGCEALYVLVPVAAGLPDTPEIRASYREAVLDHVEAVIGEKVRDAIGVERIFTLNDFSSAYNAYRGTALGLAHTLRQTAIFRPRHRSRAVSNLWYTGAYTHPGIGVPMAFISSQIVAGEIAKQAD
jgi:1-hydroxy-2-isopentenylcarotenoid 3,4-desaturase